MTLFRGVLRAGKPPKNVMVVRQKSYRKKTRFGAKSRLTYFCVTRRRLILWSEMSSKYDTVIYICPIRNEETLRVVLSYFFQI